MVDAAEGSIFPEPDADSLHPAFFFHFLSGVFVKKVYQNRVNVSMYHFVTLLSFRYTSFISLRSYSFVDFHL